MRLNCFVGVSEMEANDEGHLSGNGQSPASQWRHKKRGTMHEIIATAELQMSTDLVDGAELIIYRGGRRQAMGEACRRIFRWPV